MHYQDETHMETNPSLYKVWHRRGVQPTIPAAGTNRRLTVFGSVEARGRGRVEVICPAQDSACFARYLVALDARHVATGKEVYLVLDNGPCHKSKVTEAALAARSAWLHVLWLAPYSPQLNPKEREWKRLKRDARSHLAPTLRAFVDEIAAALATLVVTASISSIRCRTGSSPATARSPPAVWRDAHGGPRIPTSGHPIARR